MSASSPASARPGRECGQRRSLRRCLAGPAAVHLRCSGGQIETFGSGRESVGHDLQARDLSDGAPDPLGRLLDFPVSQMDVAQGGADIRMAQQPRDHRHRHPVHHRMAGVGVAEVGWNVTGTVRRLASEPGTLWRLLSGRAGVSANMALALDDIGWGITDHWMRMQAGFDLALARRDRASTVRRSGTMHS